MQQRRIGRTAIRTLAAACAAAAISLPALADEVKCGMSKWGPNDQIGNLNHLGSHKVLQAMKTVTKGKAYQLGIETNRLTPAFPPRNYAVTVLQPNQVNGVSLGPTKMTYNDDIVMGWNGVGSQIDGLGHIGVDAKYFNCLKGEDIGKVTGLAKYGIETLPPIATRGILLDMVPLYGKDGLVPEGTAFNRAEIEAAMKRQGIKSIDKGDVVLFHTGWTSLIGKDDKRYGSVEPGLGREGARYLAGLGVAAIGADTWGLEVLPFEKGAGVFEVHQILLPENGIFILENMETAEMAKDQAWEFLFTLGPSRLTGAVQAIINPIAIK